jgi:hypothetical protein
LLSVLVDTAIFIVCMALRLKFFFLSYLMGLEFELRAWHLQAGALWLELIPSVHFALVILETGSQELFAWADLKPQFSQSCPLT